MSCISVNKTVYIIYWEVQNAELLDEQFSSLVFEAESGTSISRAGLTGEADMISSFH